MWLSTLFGGLHSRYEFFLSVETLLSQEVKSLKEKDIQKCTYFELLTIYTGLPGKISKFFYEFYAKISIILWYFMPICVQYYVIWCQFCITFYAFSCYWTRHRVKNGYQACLYTLFCFKMNILVGEEIDSFKIWTSLTSKWKNMFKKLILSLVKKARKWYNHSTTKDLQCPHSQIQDGNILNIFLKFWLISSWIFL